MNERIVAQKKPTQVPAFKFLFHIKKDFSVQLKEIFCLIGL